MTSIANAMVAKHLMRFGLSAYQAMALPYEKFAEMIDAHWDGIAAYCKLENKVSLGYRMKQRGRALWHGQPAWDFSGRTCGDLEREIAARIVFASL